MRLKHLLESINLVGPSHSVLFSFFQSFSAIFDLNFFIQSVWAELTGPKNILPKSFPSFLTFFGKRNLAFGYYLVPEGGFLCKIPNLQRNNGSNRERAQNEFYEMPRGSFDFLCGIFRFSCATVFS